MRLKVLHIRQELPNSCWHAAARMLYGYRKLGCAHPLPGEWAQDRGIGAAQFVDLAKSIGLKTLPRVNQSFDWTFLEDSLRSYGPLWAAGQWNGPNHIVVITGVESGGQVYVCDPAFPTPVTRNMGWFNDRIDKSVDVPLMYLP